MAESEHFLRAGLWKKWAYDMFAGGEVHGSTLGILGMGRIGQAVARRARAFGMTIHYHNRRRLRPEVEEALEATWWDSLDQMVARVDVLSINCPHTPATFHLMNARRLKLMKPTAVIVNTSRGEVVDGNALTRMLRAGEIAGAGLDVHERGSQVNPRLRELPNVVLLPHMGSATVEGRTEMGEKVIINIRTFADGHRPPDLVVPVAE
jgi:glyoxylate reductase